MLTSTILMSSNEELNIKKWSQQNIKFKIPLGYLYQDFNSHFSTFYISGWSYKQ